MKESFSPFAGIILISTLGQLSAAKQKLEGFSPFAGIILISTDFVDLWLAGVPVSVRFSPRGAQRSTPLGACRDYFNFHYKK
jgi:hypothetical protein